MDFNFPPASLEARTKDDLRKLMVVNNQRHGKEFHYFDFTFAKGRWHCWFEIRTVELLTERLNRGNKQQ